MRNPPTLRDYWDKIPGNASRKVDGPHLPYFTTSMQKDGADCPDAMSGLHSSAARAQRTRIRAIGTCVDNTGVRPTDTHRHCITTQTDQNDATAIKLYKACFSCTRLKLPPALA